MRQKEGDVMSDDDVKKIVEKIQGLCVDLDWSMTVVADEDGGLAGVILGTEDFVFEFVNEDGEIIEQPGNDELH